MIIPLSRGPTYLPTTLRLCRGAMQASVELGVHLGEYSAGGLLVLANWYFAATFQRAPVKATGRRWEAGYGILFGLCMI
jgi:hypothetical protein